MIYTGQVQQEVVADGTESGGSTKFLKTGDGRAAEGDTFGGFGLFCQARKGGSHLGVKSDRLNKENAYHLTRASSVSFLLSTACIGLVLGLLVYILDRQPGSVYILPNWLEVMGPHTPVFGLIGDQIPTFVHTVAFSLLTYALLAPTPGAALLSAIAWLSIDSLFEIAQASAVAHWISSHSPDGLASIPFIENIPSYFLAGTFDPLDLVSIAAGAVLAYLISRFSQKEDKP